VVFYYANSILSPPADLKIAVTVYSMALAGMVVATIVGTTHRYAIGIIGSVMFAVSDLLIGFGKFNVFMSFHVYVMVLYYAAQALLYSSKNSL
jgi:uncharacterized membrane protein YhhN